MCMGVGAAVFSTDQYIVVARGGECLSEIICARVRPRQPDVFCQFRRDVERAEKLDFRGVDHYGVVNSPWGARGLCAVAI